MPIRRRLQAVLAGAIFLSLTGIGQVAAQERPELGPDVERSVVPPSSKFKSSDADEAKAMARVVDFTEALARRDYAAAYAMLRLSMQASTPRLEWEMSLRKRDGLWADGRIRILRLTWYPDPTGQPPGLYAAFDFRGDRSNGAMDCGYLVVHRATPESGFSLVRTDTSEVPASMMEEGVPKADLLRKLPCYLGKGIATDI